MKLLVSVLAAASANPTCDAGWEWDQTENNNTGACVDVNECNNGGCLGTNGANSCMNLEGSWECGCADGFTLQELALEIIKKYHFRETEISEKSTRQHQDNTKD